MKLETATPSYVRLEYKLPSKIYAQKPCSTCLRAERQAIMELTAAVCTFLMRRRFKKLLLKQPFVSEKKKDIKIPCECTTKDRERCYPILWHSNKNCIFRIITTILYKFHACVVCYITIGTNLNCSDVTISRASHILRTFNTLCYPEFKLPFVMPLCSILLTTMNALEKEQSWASVFMGLYFSWLCTWPTVISFHYPLCACGIQQKQRLFYKKSTLG